jgi:hypothetical protein
MAQADAKLLHPKCTHQALAFQVSPVNNLQRSRGCRLDAIVRKKGAEMMAGHVSRALQVPVQQKQTAAVAAPGKSVGIAMPISPLPADATNMPKTWSDAAWVTFEGREGAKTFTPQSTTSDQSIQLNMLPCRP